MKIKQAIQALRPYQVNDLQADIILNANETKNYLFDKGITLDFNTSKYPNTFADSLRESLSKQYALAPENFVLGNGSTELLEILVKTFSEKNDTVLTFSPTFSMYQIYAQIHEVKYETIPLHSDMTLSIQTLIEADDKLKPSIIFVCNPNNPTGTLIPKEDIIQLLNNTQALVVVDEAYMEFADEQESLVAEIGTYDNLIIARTFSKAYGLAGLRIGYMIGNTQLIDTLFKVKLPYSLNQASIQYGLKALSKTTQVKQFIRNLIKERDILYNQLKALDLTVYPSSTNFLYIKANQPLDALLLKKGILIRSFNNGYYRITIGNATENQRVIQALKEVYHETK
ncbi:MAG: histidinol-phosphate transaminase [Candidatus Izemoplasma sp.]|nr:histidinol-phosphate transaminase [Candidatus Izemoplasma sp.]